MATICQRQWYPLLSLRRLDRWLTSPRTCREDPLSTGSLFYEASIFRSADREFHDLPVCCMAGHDILGDFLGGSLGREGEDEGEGDGEGQGDALHGELLGVWIERFSLLNL